MQQYESDPYHPAPMSQVMADQGYSEAVCLRAGRTSPLFCVHLGNFEEMAAAMPENQCVYGLRLSNLNVAGTPLSVERLAISHLQQIRKVQQHGPYRLIGYSFGGMVAYETARLLMESGEDVDLLALVDTLHPLFRQNLSPTESIQFRKTYLSDRLRKYSRNLIQGRFDIIGSDVVKFTGGVAKPIVWKVAQRVCLALDRPLPAFSESVIFEGLLRSYRPKEFAGRVVLFRVENAMDAGPEFDDDPSMGWGKCAKKGVDVQFVPGTHGTVIHLPNVRDLVKKLSSYLG